MTHTIPSLESLEGRLAPSALGLGFQYGTSTGVSAQVGGQNGQGGQGGAAAGGAAQGGAQVVIPAKDLSAGSTALAGLMHTASKQTQADLTSFAQKGSAVTAAQLNADLATEQALAGGVNAVARAEFAADADVAQMSTSSSQQLLQVLQAQEATFGNLEATLGALDADSAAVAAAEASASTQTPAATS